MQNVDLARIEMLVMDVDGVLTDGSLVIHADGSETKSFSSLDGHGIRMWKRAGLGVALISGRASEATQCRAEQLGIEYVFQDCHYKQPVLEKLLGQLPGGRGAVREVIEHVLKTSGRWQKLMERYGP
ncbi:MAG: hypothetical protein P8Z79_14615 [Sedimentisphaerales bacterium]